MLILKYLKIILNPVIFIKSKRISDFKIKDNKDKICTEEKFYEFGQNQLSDMDKLIEHCLTVFNKKKSKVLKNYKPPATVIIGKVDNDKITNEQVEELKPIIKFASQPLLMHLASSYMQKIPMIISATLTYAKSLDDKQSHINFQNYHSDLLDKSVLHLVIPIKKIASNNGPFTFIDAINSKRIMTAINYQGGRISDSMIDKFINKMNVTELTGEPGKAWFLSPYYCLHMGARIKKGSRLMLVVSYASPNMCIEHACNLGKKDRKERLLDNVSSRNEKALLRVYN